MLSDCIINVINLNCVGSYVDSLDWIKNKKDAINSRNNSDKYFQYSARVTLIHGKIGKRFTKNIRN